MQNEDAKPGRRVRGAGKAWLCAVAGLVLAASLTATVAHDTATAKAAAEPATTGGPPGFRRLNEGQYLRSIEQIFGPGITVPGRFDPPLREEGLMAIGDGKVVVSASGLEQYEVRAREIASQALARNGTKGVTECSPQPAPAFDRGCAAAFLGKYGRLLYRRPLTERELSKAMAVASAASERTGSFHKGLEAGLSRFLVSPKFIFRVEQTEPSAGGAAVQRLDAYSLATRISFLLWDAPPDEELLDAAERGDLRDPKKLQKQVDRLIASPRFEQGVRSFFSDMLGYEQFQGLSKDQAIYPKFSTEMANDAQEQTLRTIVDHLVTRKGDYRDLFITRRTFINRNLGALYKVPVEEEGVDGWAPYTFAPSDPRGGILSLAGFLMLDPTHEGRSSPTIRGKTVRELLLCQQVPQPPPNVDFAVVQDVKNPQYRTARQRLTIHQENPACAGCHALTDPIGLGLENYDAIGDFRTHENGALIDATGTFEGKPYEGLLGFSRLLRDSPQVPNCLVQRAYEYGVGRPAAAGDNVWLEYAAEAFARDKYQLPALMRRIALSSAFQIATGEQPLAPPPAVAAR